MIRLELDSDGFARLAKAVQTAADIPALNGLREFGIDRDGSVVFMLDRPHLPKISIRLEVSKASDAAIRIKICKIGFASKLLWNGFIKFFLRDPANLVVKKSGGLLIRESSDAFLLDVPKLLKEKLHASSSVRVAKALARNGVLTAAFQLSEPCAEKAGV